MDTEEIAHTHSPGCISGRDYDTKTRKKLRQEREKYCGPAKAPESARAAVPKTLTETLHTASRIHNFLLASIKGMAFGADIDVEVFRHCRAHFNDVSAAAGRLDVIVLRMNLGLHGSTLLVFGAAQFTRIRKPCKKLKTAT